MHGKTAGSGAEKKTCKAGLLALLWLGPFVLLAPSWQTAFYAVQQQSTSLFRSPGERDHPGEGFWSLQTTWPRPGRAAKPWIGDGGSTQPLNSSLAPLFQLGTKASGLSTQYWFPRWQRPTCKARSHGICSAVPLPSNNTQLQPTASYQFPAHHCRAACRFPLFPQQLIHHFYLSTLLPAAVLCLPRWVCPAPASMVFTSPPDFPVCSSLFPRILRKYSSAPKLLSLPHCSEPSEAKTFLLLVLLVSQDDQTSYHVLSFLCMAGG